MTAISGLNSMAHAVEATYAKDANPIVSILEAEGIRSLATALPRIMTDPNSLTARSLALFGAWLCGKCLATTSVALHHKLCHVLGGSFNLPHAETHAIILPHVVTYNAPNISETMKALEEVIPNSNGDAIQALNLLLFRLGTPTSLQELGMKEEDIDKAVDILMAKPFWNPRTIEREPIRELIRRAWKGEPARVDLDPIPPTGQGI